MYNFYNVICFTKEKRATKCILKIYKFLGHNIFLSVTVEIFLIH